MKMRAETIFSPDLEKARNCELSIFFTIFDAEEDLVELKFIFCLQNLESKINPFYCFR